MKHQKVLILFARVIVLCACSYGYAIRYLNLGLTNMLDGGPIRPKPGWYFQNIAELYTTHKFLDNKGCLFGGVPSPRYSFLTLFPQALYEFDYKIMNARYGFQATLPVGMYLHVEKNNLGFTNSGGGFGDLNIGAFLQWDPLFYKDREVFVHRLSFDVALPTGRVREPQYFFNQGNNFFFINPYWAATVFLSSRVNISWRAFYSWYGFNKKTGIQIGDAFHINFAGSIEAYSKLWIGLTGYFLHSIHDNKKCGERVPDSKEQVLGLGPGILYYCPKEVDIFGHFYVETKTLNRTQGIKCVFRLIKHF